MSAAIFKVVLLTIVSAAVAAVGWWARHHVNRDKKHPERVRFPRFVQIIGCFFVAIGLLLLVMSRSTFADGRPDWVGSMIAGIASVAGGIYFLVLYRNWWFVLGEEVIDFQRLTGKAKRIRYVDIVDYQTVSTANGPHLTIKTADGTKFSLPSRTFDVTPLEVRYEFFRRFGYWPNFQEYARFVEGPARARSWPPASEDADRGTRQVPASDPGANPFGPAHTTGTDRGATLPGPFHPGRAQQRRSGFFNGRG